MRGKLIKIRKSQIPYFISGIIIFTNRFNGTNINYSIKYIVAGIWATLLFGSCYFSSEQCNKKKQKI